jgi:hypothetical protein
VLTSEFNTFTNKVANEKQAKDERNEILKQIRGNASKTSDIETVLSNLENSVADINI